MTRILPERAVKLLALVDLISQAAKVVIEEWDKEDALGELDDSTSTLPSLELYNAQRTVIGTCGAIAGLVHPPEARLLEVSAGYFEARALHIAAKHRVADHLAKINSSIGMSADDLSKMVGIHPAKLTRIMRTLCSTHVFAEVRDGRFANNTISTTLAHNEPLRAHIIAIGFEMFKASVNLPDYLADPVKGWSYSATCTPFQDAFGTEHSIWDWFEEGVVQPDGSTKPRPELENFGLAMIGFGRLLGAPLYYDYPWASLGVATVVDVAGGHGGMCLDLMKLYPLLKFVIQDRAPVLKRGRLHWEREQPGALESDQAQLMPHDLFQDNPVKDAEIYVLRRVLHDWDDDACVSILSALRSAMGPSSRILIADQVMNTTLGCVELPSAPKPLPANYGVHTRLAHAHDLNMMTAINGAERTPAEFRTLAEGAELEMVRIWECRGIMSLVELRLPGLNA